MYSGGQAENSQKEKKLGHGEPGACKPLVYFIFYLPYSCSHEQMFGSIMMDCRKNEDEFLDIIVQVGWGEEENVWKEQEKKDYFLETNVPFIFKFRVMEMEGRHLLRAKVFMNQYLLIFSIQEFDRSGQKAICSAPFKTQSIKLNVSPRHEIIEY